MKDPQRKFSSVFKKYPNHLLEIEAKEIVGKKIKATLPKKLWFNNRIAVEFFCDW